MSSKAISDPEAFWQFACDLYAKDGVQSLCLCSQNTLGLNINVILFCAWLKRFDKQLTASQWQTIRQAIAPSDFELAKLRQQRNRYVKGTEHYRTCLRQELKLEAQQQKHILRTIENTVLPDADEHPLLGYFESMTCTDTLTRNKFIVLFNTSDLHDHKDVSH